MGQKGGENYPGINKIECHGFLAPSIVFWKEDPSTPINAPPPKKKHCTLDYNIPPRLSRTDLSLAVLRTQRGTQQKLGD